jgi:hypothetical protein
LSGDGALQNYVARLIFVFFDYEVDLPLRDALINLNLDIPTTWGGGELFQAFHTTIDGELVPLLTELAFATIRQREDIANAVAINWHNCPPGCTDCAPWGCFLYGMRVTGPHNATPSFGWYFYYVFLAPIITFESYSGTVVLTEEVMIPLGPFRVDFHVRHGIELHETYIHPTQPPIEATGEQLFPTPPAAFELLPVPPPNEQPHGVTVTISTYVHPLGYTLSHWRADAGFPAGTTFPAIPIGGDPDNGWQGTFTMPNEGVAITAIWEQTIPLGTLILHNRWANSTNSPILLHTAANPLAAGEESASFSFSSGDLYTGTALPDYVSMPNFAGWRLAGTTDTPAAMSTFIMTTPPQGIVLEAVWNGPIPTPTPTPQIGRAHV